MHVYKGKMAKTFLHLIPDSKIRSHCHSLMVPIFLHSEQVLHNERTTLPGAPLPKISHTKRPYYLAHVAT